MRRSIFSFGDSEQFTIAFTLFILLDFHIIISPHSNLYLAYDYSFHAIIVYKIFLVAISIQSLVGEILNISAPRIPIYFHGV